jgi:hypothetical protein
MNNFQCLGRPAYPLDIRGVHSLNCWYQRQISNREATWVQRVLNQRRELSYKIPETTLKLKALALNNHKSLHTGNMLQLEKILRKKFQLQCLLLPSMLSLACSNHLSILRLSSMLGCSSISLASLSIPTWIGRLYVRVRPAMGR